MMMSGFDRRSTSCCLMASPPTTKQALEDIVLESSPTGLNHVRNICILHEFSSHLVTLRCQLSRWSNDKDTSGCYSLGSE